MFRQGSLSYHSRQLMGALPWMKETAACWFWPVSFIPSSKTNFFHGRACTIACWVLCVTKGRALTLVFPQCAYHSCSLCLIPLCCWAHFTLSNKGYPRKNVRTMSLVQFRMFSAKRAFSERDLGTLARSMAQVIGLTKTCFRTSRHRYTKRFFRSRWGPGLLRFPFFFSFRYGFHCSLTQPFR